MVHFSLEILTDENEIAGYWPSKFGYTKFRVDWYIIVAGNEENCVFSNTQNITIFWP